MEKNEIERLIRDINSLEFEHEHINKKINQLKNEAIEIEKQIQLKKASLNQLKNGLKNERLTQGSNCYNKHYHHPSTKSLSSTGYNDARWLAKREEILKRDLYKCQMCHGTAQEVHHINYLDERRQPINNEYWRSPNENLVSLCHNCHEKFDGTKCEDTVFIPAKHPIKIEKMTDDNAHGVLVNPKWEEIVPYLRNIQIYGDGYRERLLLVVLCPYFTSLGKELLLKEPKQGLNELEKVQLLCRYTKDISPKIFINDLRRLSVEYPSTKQNVNYIINHLSPLLSQCKERPTEGVIVMASRNKRNGYYISIFDIKKKRNSKKMGFF